MRPQVRFLSVALLVAALLMMTACGREASVTPTLGPGPSVASTPSPTAEATDEATATPTVYDMPFADTPPTGTVPATTATPDPTAAPSTHRPGAGGSTPAPDVHTSFEAAPDRDLVELARSLRLKTPTPIDLTATTPAGAMVPGRVDEFWLVSLSPVATYRREFELRHVSPNAYWYVQSGLRVADVDIQRAARAFEDDIYPRTTALWGTEWKPGVDNDPRLTILTGRLSGGLGGYFSSADEYPATVAAYSNQREMVYMSGEYDRVGSPNYLSVLTHELFHAVAWAADPSEDTWVSEGMAELSTDLLGRNPILPYIETPSPTPSLVNWPLEPLSSANYAYSLLFFQYLAQRLGDSEDLARLLRHPANGVEGVDAYLRSVQGETGFRELFADWLVANLLDQPEGGRYGYSGLEVGVSRSKPLSYGESRQSVLPQYAAEYMELAHPEGAVTLRFEGEAHTPLLPTDVGPGGCWWSNRGDSISSSLTRRVDLSAAASPSLRYRIWHEIEEGWDYAYVEVSSDGGVTWDILPAEGTTLEDPVGNSYGHGYTGITRGWVQADADLSPYAGKEVDLRFHYVTDDSVNGSGLCVDGISIPEVGFEDSPGESGWIADGFLRTSNRVAQDYVVRVVETGQEPTVTTMPLDGSNRGELRLGASPGRESVVLVVAALAPKTRQPAGYRLSVAPGAS